MNVRVLIVPDAVVSYAATLVCCGAKAYLLIKIEQNIATITNEPKNHVEK